MNFAIFIMHEYQKKHNVKDCSMTNCQLIFDLFKLKVRPCFVMLHDEKACGAHLVNMLDDKTFIDATYQFSHRKDVEYLFDPILMRDDAKAELTKMQVLKRLSAASTNELLTTSPQVYADMINNGHFLINDDKLYADQWDMMEKFMNSMESRCT